MDLQNLKEFTIFYIYEHENLTKNEKEEFVNFVKEANEDKIVNLLITGRMANEKDAIISEAPGVNFPTVGSPGSKHSIVNNKDVLRYIDDMIRMSWKEGHGTGMTRGIGITVVVASAAFAAYKLYKRFLSKAARACSDKSGTEKTSCMNKYKNAAIRNRISALKVSTKMCSKTKDPKKCTQKIEKKISKLKAKLGE